VRVLRVMSGVFEEFQWRGLVHQVTDPDLGKLLDRESLTAYIGFDPTGDSLHAGSLLPVLNLRRLQEADHKVIPLLGGGTGLIGDPSGRDSERQLLSEGELEANLLGIRRQIESILHDDARVLDNGEWLKRMTLTEFLRDVGKYFSVNEMVRKESVKTRLEAREQGISFTEFSYMLLQAWDFVHLFDAYGCRLQLGGSDQWGNITEGVDLIRRLRGEQAFGLTSPLLTLPGGAKMGKSEGAARVWLDPKRTSPYQFFQYWVRADDAQVGSYLRFFTFLERGRIEELDKATADHPERREAQQALAWEVTSLVHGEAEASKAKHAAEVLFTEDVAGLDEATLLDVMSDAPASDVPRDGIGLIDALVESGLAKSKSAARTAIEQGGAYVNNRREGDLDRRITVDDALHGRYVLLRRGKRDHHLLRLA
jgi:tyrosyl-tRNA synthetase